MKERKNKNSTEEIKDEIKQTEPVTEAEIQKPKPVLMQGNEAVARAAVALGIDFFAGYPITPSTEIAEVLSYELPKVGGKYIQMEDEIASICAVIGASLSGAKAMTATSGPGFSLMQEAIGYAKISETPCVIVNVQRGGPSTGLPTKPSQGDLMQSRWGSHGDSPAIVLYPHSVREAYELTIRAFNLSEKYRTCVVLLLDEVLGHMREAVVIPDISKYRKVNRVKPTVPPDWYKHYEENQKYLSPVASYGDGYRFHVTGLSHDSSGFPTNKAIETHSMMVRLKKKITQNIRDLVQIESFMMEDAQIAIFATGIVARSAKSAAIISRKNLGIKVGVLRPLTIWPFADDAVKKMLKTVDTVIVPELNQGQLIHEIERLTKDKDDSKIIKLQKFNGELITPDEIIKKVKEAI